jgi:hypothetical protein
LPKIASKVTGNIYLVSRVKQKSRWVQNEHITFDLYFLPFVLRACDGYCKRMNTPAPTAKQVRVETFFSDQKSRGF